ncbi:phosphodiester glycosidase family protein [Candidatus Zixiibacteriota bacterium]
MTHASHKHQPTSLPSPHRLKLLPALLLPVLLLLSCAGDRATPRISVEWKPVASLRDSLPDGISVYEGQDDDIPLKAWYVRVEPGAGFTARVTVSDDTDQKENVAEFAGRTGAVVAVNGGYFRMDEDPARHVGLLYIEGRAVEPSFESIVREETRYPITRAAFGITDDGRYDIAWVASRNDSLFEWGRPPRNIDGEPAQPIDFLTASLWEVRDALAAGPSLLSRGRIDITADEEVFFGSTIPRIHPRTAVGYTRSGALIILVVDGRQAASRGVDLVELASLMQDLDCEEAINLDGGGSSTIVVNGILLNRPTGGIYQREVMSALVVVEEPEQQ